MSCEDVQSPPPQPLKSYLHPCKLYAASTQCSHGEVRLVNGSVPNEGRVEVCVNSNWGIICEDNRPWDTEEAMVVCRQLGYTPEG